MSRSGGGGAYLERGEGFFCDECGAHYGPRSDGRVGLECPQCGLRPVRIELGIRVGEGEPFWAPLPPIAEEIFQAMRPALVRLVAELVREFAG
jgi:hypothetical protein